MYQRLRSVSMYVFTPAIPLRLVHSSSGSLWLKLRTALDGAYTVHMGLSDFGLFVFENNWGRSPITDDECVTDGFDSTQRFEINDNNLAENTVISLHC